MATIGQIRGMLLEELLLYLLHLSGYKTIEDAISDPDTLYQGRSGMEVLGRGSSHQIDAIADFVIAHPFSHPQRLLVEAKCYERNTVGIEVVRNAVGVLKDVGEYWTSRGGIPDRNRYHYQYALFSATNYTSGAERYAFAHDVYLIPLSRSTYITPLLNAIKELSPRDFGASSPNQVEVDMAELRADVRACMKVSDDYPLGMLIDPMAIKKIYQICSIAKSLLGALLGMIAQQFPVFLVPAPNIHISELPDVNQVHIYWDQTGWYLHSQSEKPLFSFDLPPALFERYAEQGLLTQPRALDLKEQVLSEIQATMTIGQQVRVIRFQLDRRWVQDVRERLSYQSTPKNG